MKNTNTVIAGQHGGKKVTVVPAVKPAFELLRKKAIAGNHWARLAVSGLTSLASGRLGKDNIFVRPNLTVAHGIEEFFVFLPGCKATVQREQNDNYRIVNLTVDAGYFEANNLKTMTGLYTASKSDKGWTAKHVQDGKLVSDTAKSRFTLERIVGISDGVYEDAESAAGQMAPLISNAPRGTDAAATEYDLHFTRTKQGGSFGGLKNYRIASKPLTNSEIYGSAQLLADTMHKAKDIAGINWVAEFGGAAVLTQAMKILVDRGVKLEQHGAFLYRPNTSTHLAAQLSHQLGLKLDRKFVETKTFDYMGNRDQVRMIFSRVRAKEKGYTTGNACFDLVCQGKNIQAGVGMSVAALSAVGISMSMPVIPILASLGGALGFAVGGLRMGDTLAEHVCPRLYNKHIGKIK